ncbi:MAG: hypothetical protein DMG72_05000 [Acidobacteria bacterium]|nr:MAG: hypothetical protein DMG72_05000 [Acidobacteriota bacterium]
MSVAREQANVNSHLLSDASLVVVDLLRNSLEAEKLADHVEARGKKLEMIFVTHGHLTARPAAESERTIEL